MSVIHVAWDESRCSSDVLFEGDQLMGTFIVQSSRSNKQNRFANDLDPKAGAQEHYYIKNISMYTAAQKSGNSHCHCIHSDVPPAMSGDDREDLFVPFFHDLMIERLEIGLVSGFMGHH
ncbi:hypothetical protein Ddc_10625 [Ditylenchus destructor]|nr:hypothetical protein Ddc_10625 [Ditylenchus destructor]